VSAIDVEARVEPEEDSVKGNDGQPPSAMWRTVWRARRAPAYTRAAFPIGGLFNFSQGEPMSDHVTGRIAREGTNSTQQVVLEFQGKMKKAEWDKFVERMRKILQTDFGGKVKLTEVGGAGDNE
jgi:hypothetical protein